MHQRLKNTLFCSLSYFLSNDLIKDSVSQFFFFFFCKEFTILWLVRWPKSVVIGQLNTALQKQRANYHIWISAQWNELASSSFENACKVDFHQDVNGTYQTLPGFSLQCLRPGQSRRCSWVANKSYKSLDSTPLWLRPLEMSDTPLLSNNPHPWETITPFIPHFDLWNIAALLHSQTATVYHSLHER